MANDDKWKINARYNVCFKFSKILTICFDMSRLRLKCSHIKRW
jgi:hypothetical protein